MFSWSNSSQNIELDGVVFGDWEKSWVGLNFC